ncbi:MAG: PEP-CTERM sorting domain-containing protein [Candidatus Brocadiia bacterium]
MRARQFAAPLVVILAVSLCAAAQPAAAESIWGLEGGSGSGLERYTMTAINPASPPGGAVYVSNVPEYHWWLGCSPTAAGMLFGFWDSQMGKSNLFTYGDGDGAFWDETNMNEDNQDHYGLNGGIPSCATHSMVASWEHRQAGAAVGLTHGTWDRDNNGVVDPTDRASWNCLADFMRTVDGGTYRSNMAQGFIDYALWDAPTTGASESYNANAWTEWESAGELTFDDYRAEIDAGYPVHVGIPGHSILGLGYYYENDLPYVINWTTWGGWDDTWGSVAWSEVYAATFLRIGDQIAAIPEPCTLGLLGLAVIGICAARRRSRAV